MGNIEELDRTWEFAANKARRTGDFGLIYGRLDPHLSWLCGWAYDLAPITEEEFVEVYWRGMEMALDDQSSPAFFDFMERAKGYMVLMRTGEQDDAVST